MTVINIEQGMPTADQALQKLQAALRQAKIGRQDAVKVIHGYGSTGRGGVIKSRMRGFLSGQKRQGLVRAFVSGEDFTPFSADGRRAVDICPALSRDRDYGRGNPGITIVLL